jgi:hypothetical protein
MALAVGNLTTAFHEDAARLRCAIVMLAAERYRLEHGKWPETIAELVPQFLDSVPLDPFDGQPLRWRRREGGMVVYSIGNDLADDGGQVHPRATNLQSPGDTGYRLWDVAERRLAARTN